MYMQTSTYQQEPHYYPYGGWMGNITGLTRSGLQDDNSYGLIDNLSFDYNGNQLLKVTDAVTSGPNYSGAFHFNDHSNASIEYTYDANGNMTKDRNKYIMSVTYNTLNLPVDVLYEDNSYTYSTSFHYAGDGRPLRVNHSLKKIKPLFPFKGFSGLDDIQKVVFPGIIKPNPAEMYNGDEFCGSLTYHSGTISYMSVDGGYVTFNSGTPTYHFYIHDHLGNNRAVVNESGTVEQVNHYYPYGGLMGESTGGDIQKYKYNGKRLERNHGLDWYDYGARHYDAAIGSWPTMDPLCEKYYSISPYVYCHNNSVNLIDPDGMDDYYTNSGQFIFRDDKETDNIIIRNQFLYDMKLMSGAVWINSDTPIENADISAEAYSAIYTDILKKAGFDTNKLLNGQISIVKLKDNTAGDGPQYEADGFYNHKAVIPYRDADVARYMNIDGKHQVTAYCHPLGDANRGYLSTVSNVISVLGVHEFECHGERKMNSEQHWKILQIQREHYSWNKVTPQLKDLYRYLETSKINYSRPR